MADAPYFAGKLLTGEGSIGRTNKKRQLHNLSMAEFTTPKGMKDFSGAEMMVRQRMLLAIEKQFRLWGYQPLSTPALEMVETLEKKCGAEIKGQLFRIDDGKLAMRFDMTVPLARFSANSSVPKPYKRYAIGPVWRREEPQKGRMREFLQADADIIGCKEMRAEAELLAMANETLEMLGFANCTILLNNRKILSGMAAKYGVENDAGLFRALDKLGKIPEAAIAEELGKLGIGENEAEELLLMLTEKTGNKKALSNASEFSEEGAKELALIVDELELRRVKNAVVDLSLARGLDYYTGPVFEIKASDEIGSVAGGGRYDNLLGMYGQAECAVGISLGIERLMALSAKEGAATPTKVLVVGVKDEPKIYAAALEAAKFLRAAGVPCETDLQGRPMRKQLEYANALGIPYALIVGEEEIKAGKFTLKNLTTGGQEKAAIEEIAAELRKAAGAP